MEETRRNPRRFDHTKLFPSSKLGMDKWDKTDTVGFLIWPGRLWRHHRHVLVPVAPDCRRVSQPHRRAGPAAGHQPNPSPTETPFLTMIPQSCLDECESGQEKEYARRHQPHLG